MEVRVSVRIRRCVAVLCCVVVCLYCIRADAAPTKGDIFHLTQPDGRLVAVRIWGDEFYQVVESPDGYTLVRDAQTGCISYADLSEDGNCLVSTGVVVPAAGQLDPALRRHLRIPQALVAQEVRMRRADLGAGDSNPPRSRAPVTNKAMSAPRRYRTICMVIDFADEPNSVPSPEIDAFCNEVGYSGNGNNGSVRDYFFDVSDGVADYVAYVPHDYYRATLSKAYYDDPGISVGPRARELITEALNHLEAEGFDFTEYDIDGDGRIDGITCLYAGSTQAGWAKGLWPHSGSFTESEFNADGVSAYKYQISGIGAGLSLGVFCHETGHLLFNWPDLYDTDYDSMGVGSYCLMGYGGRGGNPVEPCAYLKHISGWTDTRLLNARGEEIVLAAGDNTICMYERAGSSNEYFLIENRFRSGRDAGLPDSGIALWHIDELGWNNNQQMSASTHYRVSLMQADGQWDLERDVNGGDGGDLWKGPDFTVCGPYDNTVSTNWWDGAESGFGLLGVSPASESMTCVYDIDPLVIAPEGDFEADGSSGGPFSPAEMVYTLTNAGDSPIDYEVAMSGSWFEIDDGTPTRKQSASGTLEAKASVDIRLVLSDSANGFAEGYYTGRAIFRSLTNGVDRSRDVVLNVHDPVVVYETDFSDGLPAGWTVVDGLADGMTWGFDNPLGRTSAYMAEPFVLVDSMVAGYVNMDEQLVSPVIDCSKYDSITLNFGQKLWRTSKDTVVAEVDMRAGQGEWTNIAAFYTGNEGAVSVQLPSAADGHPAVQIRWHYIARFDFFWAIDNVRVTAACRDDFVSDINTDCDVDTADLALFAGRWLDNGCGVVNRWCGGADSDHSATVDMNDMSRLAREW